MSLAIDGSAVTGSWSSGSSFSTSGLTTSNANDVLVAAVVINSPSPAQTVSSISATGTSGWAKRASVTIGTGVEIELWYGVAASPLVTKPITITLTGTPSNSANAQVFAVSGADTSVIHDSNVSLPATALANTSSTPTVSGISTSNGNDMIIAVLANSGSAETAGSGYTLITTGGSTFLSGSEYKIVSATQSSISATFATAATHWGMIVDAIVALQPPLAFPIHPMKRAYLRR